MHAVLPLLEQATRLPRTRSGRAAAWSGRYSGGRGCLYFPEHSAQNPSRERAAILRVDPEPLGSIAIQAEFRIDEGRPERNGNLLLGTPGETLTRPVFLTGWTSWEQECGHHDALTDIFSCGLLLASLATGLDFNTDEGLQEFINHRHDLFTLHKSLHPVIARIIVEMTAPSRHQRLQNLPAAIHSLRHYRRQSIALDEELVVSQGQDLDEAGARRTILEKLRERLFDISRRNRLLYFKSTLGMVGMTEASIPLRLDMKQIKADSHLPGRVGSLATCVPGSSIPLGEVLRFEDAPYLPGVLDRLRSEDRKQRNEIGFSPLRLALIFMRWHNLKGDASEKEERITSPLLLLPVRVDKKKGVRDAYVLSPQSSELESQSSSAAPPQSIV